jgi:hypothetical protein
MLAVPQIKQKPRDTKRNTVRWALHIVSNAAALLAGGTQDFSGELVVPAVTPANGAAMEPANGSAA